MRIVVHGQQAFGKAVLEALLKRGDNVIGRAAFVALYFRKAFKDDQALCRLNPTASISCSARQLRVGRV